MILAAISAVILAVMPAVHAEMTSLRAHSAAAVFPGAAPWQRHLQGPQWQAPGWVARPIRSAVAPCWVACEK